MEKDLEKETGWLDFPEVIVPVTPSYFLWPVRSPFQMCSTVPRKHLSLSAVGMARRWLPPLVCKCVEVTRENWWLWTMRTWVSCSQTCPLQSGANDCVLSKPADDNMLHTECRAKEGLSFCWVLLTLGIFYISLLVFSELVGLWREESWGLCNRRLWDPHLYPSLGSDLLPQSWIPVLLLVYQPR